jgi:histidinol-phosphate aminotransferase
MFAALAAMPSVQVWPSESNFILFRVSEGQGRNVFDQLKQRGILVKLLDGGHPHLRDCLRVTVGSEEENEQFLQNLRELVS